MKKLLVLILIAALMMSGAYAEDSELKDYENAIAQLEAGNYSAAASAFKALGSYEDSCLYYFYASARGFETAGSKANADVIYSLMPEFLDCAERLIGKTEPAVETVFQTYQEYSGCMPYQFDNFAKSEGVYYMYYRVSDISVVRNYIALFTDAGWTEQAFTGSDAEWNYAALIAPDSGAIFYVMIKLTEDMAVFMYNADIDYGFNPTEGL